METLIQRLVANPHDEEALAYAHRAGGVDPRSYAILLEKVGQATADPAYAAHWLSEAANVWSTTIGDAHHAARTLMIAIEKDPTARTAAERLAQLYRDKGDLKALVALLERLVKSLAPLAGHDRPEVRGQLVAMHEELGRLWGEQPFSRPERAVENWRRVAELDPQNVYAIYAAREMLKASQQWADAVQYFGMEQAIVDDPERKLALYRDEADVRRRAGDGPGTTQALRSARALLPDDVGLKQEVGASVLARIDAGENVPPPEREETAQIFIQLAESYDASYGISYSVSALKAQPGNDRAMQLADYYGGQLNRTAELGPQYAAYLQANPNGFMSEAARAKVGAAPVRPAQPPAPPAARARRATSSPPRRPHGAVQPTGGTRSRPVAADRACNPRRRRARPAGSAPSSPTRLGPGGPARCRRRSAAAPGRRVASPARLSPVGSGPRASDRPQPAPALSPAAIRRRRSPAAPRRGAERVGQGAQAAWAYAKFRDALKIDPAQSEALSWVEDYLRQKRMYADLRDVLLAASRVSSVSPETRKAQLRDVAGICESQLRDVETAILAWKQVCQIDRADEQAKEQLRRLLEKGARAGTTSAMLIEQEAMGTPDVEEKIALEKKLAALHESKRKDPAAAAEAWARTSPTPRPAGRDRHLPDRGQALREGRSASTSPRRSSATPVSGGRGPERQEHAPPEARRACG